MLSLGFRYLAARPKGHPVAEAAQLLQISEFAFFALAYRRWYGREAGTGEIERVFRPYMYQSVAPPWARHLAREVLDRDREGDLDPRAYGIEPQPLTWAMWTRGIRYILVLIVVMYFMFYFILTYTPYTP